VTNGDTDSSLVGFLNCLVAVQRAMTDKSRDLRQTATNVRRDLDFAYAFRTDETSSRDLEVSGYVEAELPKNGESACWKFALSLRGDQWHLIRVVERGAGGAMESVYEVPPVVFQSSDAMSAELPELVKEVLEIVV
jgi:hypothetical protein